MYWYMCMLIQILNFEYYHHILLDFLIVKILNMILEYKKFA